MNNRKQFKEEKERASFLRCIMRMAEKTCYTSSMMFIMIFIIGMTSGSMNPIDAARVSIPAETKNQKEWCIAKVGASDQALTDILHYVCVDMKIDCGPITPGSPCYNPNILSYHASFAMNRYYQSHGHGPVNCNFSGNGLIILSDPSYKSCFYDQA